MSSKLLRPENSGIAEPVAWREVGRVAERSGGAGALPSAMRERLAEIEGQYQQAIEQARAAAFREGESAGRKQAAAEIQAVVEKLARSIEELALLRPELRREAEQDMLRLALAIARRVLRRELAVDPEALHGLTLAALERLGAEQIHRVRVHPSLAPQIQALLANSAARGAVEVMADARREPGGIIFETDRGNLDASVETQLEEIERGLADRLRRRA
jgi:flagellar assembly protein FliH